MFTRREAADAIGARLLDLVVVPDVLQLAATYPIDGNQVGLWQDACYE